jgi:hypothetical protein
MNLAVDPVGNASHCCRKSVGVLLVSSFAGGAVLARLAVWAQRAGFSPLVLFPLLAGCAIGAGVYLIAKQANVCSLRALIGTSLVAAFSFLLFEHLFFYLDYRSGFNAAMGRNPSAALFAAAGEIRPVEFFEFLHAGAMQDAGLFSGWLRWIIDAAVTILAAVGSVWFIQRQSVSVGQS